MLSTILGNLFFIHSTWICICGVHEYVCVLIEKSICCKHPYLVCNIAQNTPEFLDMVCELLHLDKYVPWPVHIRAAPIPTTALATYNSHVLGHKNDAMNKLCVFLCILMFNKKKEESKMIEGETIKC